jgi:hypothetical protein
MGRIGDKDWHARFDRERDSFDRMWRWMVPLCVVIAVAFAIAYLSILAAVATWLWSLVT